MIRKAVATFCPKEKANIQIDVLKHWFVDNILDNEIKMFLMPDTDNSIVFIGFLDRKRIELPSQTIVCHFNEKTNTLFTINALNNIIIEQNGSLDKKFKVNWTGWENQCLTTNKNDDLNSHEIKFLRKINLKSVDLY